MKKILIAILLLILTVGAVSAADENITSDNLTADNNFQTQTDEILSENQTGTFQELSILIKSTEENGILELDEDYINDGNISKEGIVISKSITIDGKGHTLNADRLSRIFDITSSNVILKNIVFINGQYINLEKDYYNYDEGGAIIFNYECGNCIIDNCSFMNCFSEMGTVHFDYSSNNLINNSSFINCHAKYRGNAISIAEGEKNIINNVRFINCTQNEQSTVYFDICNGCTVNNSSFINCNGIEYFDCSQCFTINSAFIDCTNTAIYFSRGYEINDGGHGYYRGCSNCKVNNCSFINCSSSDKGGAIMFFDNMEKGTISNCIFINCKSKKGGAIYFYDYYIKKWYTYSAFEKAVVENCSFINCNAEYGGSVYVGDYSYSNIIHNCNFMNSTALFGGAVYWSGNNGRIENSNFTSSHAFNGGAVYSDKDINLKIFNSNFKNNTADKYGSAVYGAKLSKCNFSQNSKPEIYNKYAVSIDAINTNILYGSNKIYTIKVYKNTDLHANYNKVVIKLNGKSFKTLYTNDNGIASFKINQKPGNYKLTITSLGKTVTKSITVKHVLKLKSVKVKKSAKKLTLQATLKKINGKYLKNKQITFKFNNKIIKTKTNTKGIAKVTIKKTAFKNLKVGKKIKYSATYLKDTVKKTRKVLK